MVMRKLFGTDGVRGHANHYPMTPEMALMLGKAIACVFKNHDKRHKIIVGKDTRLSGYVFETALISGLCSMGIDTVMVGPLPTPGVAFMTRAYRADAGIVISASHNPYSDNGIKIFSSRGLKLSDDIETKIEKLALGGNEAMKAYLPTDSEMGRNSKATDGDGRYIEFVKATLPRRHSLKNLKIVLDCANGAAHRVAPLIFQELDAEVITIGDKPNGVNINEGCGATHPEQIQKAVLEHKADCGIALDGDADRLIMVDENAKIVDGDYILGICAKHMKQTGRLKNNRVVATVMSNYGLLKALKEEGVDVLSSPVGDRNVIQEMLCHDAILGGEQSGHIIFSEYNTTGDGLVSALQMLRIMIETDAPLSELSSFIQPYPQALQNIPVNSKVPLKEIPGLSDKIDKLNKALANEGRVLIRYSGTQNLCRIMVEAPKMSLAKRYVGELATYFQ